MEKNMKKNKETLLSEIQELLSYISNLKERQASFNSQYKELSKAFVPVVYRPKKFWDKIFPMRYKKFTKNYIESETKRKNLENLDDTILLLQMEIENCEDGLYKLQYELSKLESEDNTIENIINKDLETKEPFIND